MITKIRDFVRDKWFLFVSCIFGAPLGYCMAEFIMTRSLAWGLACVGWLVATGMNILLMRQTISTEYKVLKGKKELADSYSDLLEQTKDSIEYFNGYNEDMMESVAIYSQMAAGGVEAPVANSIIAFSQELGPEHTIILVGIDHTNSQWSVRVAGRSIYLSQLRAIWALVNRHLEENAKPVGTLIVKKDSSIIN